MRASTLALIVASCVALATAQRLTLPRSPSSLEGLRMEAEPQLSIDDDIETPVMDFNAANHPEGIRSARSLDSPSAKRGGTSPSGGTSGDTGATHPGYNRRNARSIRRQPLPYTPMRPSPFNPSPSRPWTRLGRDLRRQRVIIPNWNPNARTKPWQQIGVKTN